MNISVLGAGLMGAPIARRLGECGERVSVWNRTRERCSEAGPHVAVADSVDAALASADVVILTLSDAAAIDDVLFFDAAAQALSSRTLVQMGTISPRQSRDLAHRAEALGASYLEAPVLGSIPEARAGTLIVMAGGTPEVFDRCLPILRHLGRAPRLIGAVGQGAALKLAMNQLIGSLTTGFAYSLGLVRSEGIDVDQFMELLRDSALYAPTFDKKLARMLAGHYDNPNFPLKHLAKDMGLFLEAAGRQGQPSGFPAAIQAIIEAGCAAGLADADYSALYQAVNGAGSSRES